MKAMHTACQVVKPHGVIILVAECPQGHGSQLYIDWLKKYKTSQEIQKALQDNFVIGAHKAFYHRRTIENHPVILISEMEGPDVTGLFGFIKEKTLSHALAKAFSLSGDQSSVLVVPQGTTTFLTIKNKS
jgi:nickel-dependent lactate racemase